MLKIYDNKEVSFLSYEKFFSGLV